MNDVDERLARLLDDAVPRPPRELDGAEIRNARPRRRIVRIAAPALAAAVVVAVAVVAVVVTRPATDENGVGSGQADRPTPTDVQPVARRATRPWRRCSGCSPPHRSCRTPTRSASRPRRSCGTRCRRVRAIWSTARAGGSGHGTVSAALHYFANHLPDGLTKSGSGRRERSERTDRAKD